MTDLPPAPFTTLTVERTDADSPLDETLMQDLGTNDIFLKFRTDTLIGRTNTIEAVNTIQAGDINSLQTQITGIGPGALLLGLVGLHSGV